MSKHPRGSTWRKWDLHVHTPASILNNQFRRTNSGGPDWEAYVGKLEAANLAVVGATDYFTVDGYKFLRRQREEGRLGDTVVLPNIEFRLDTFVASRRDGERQRRLNFHVLFSEEVEPQDIEEHFLHDIYFNHSGAPGDKTDQRKLKPSNLEALGKELLEEHGGFAGRSPLEIGTMNAVVNLDHLVDILQTGHRFRDKFLLVLADEYANLIPWGGQDHNTRRILLQRSDMVFTSNPSTIAWCLGRPPYEGGRERFEKEFHSVKACIHGSDAHCPEDIGRPCAKRGDPDHHCHTDSHDCDLRCCWIKADPTFEGLRQLLYEPEERVRIQTDDPTPSKSIYCLSHVSVPKTAINGDLTVTRIDVPLNSGMVAVTGGKGSGKTALVDMLAHCFVDRRETRDPNSFVRRIARDAPELPIAVEFANDDKFTKTLTDGLFVEGSGITYIAQGELERYIDEQSDLNQYIHRVVFGSPTVRDTSDVFEYESLVQEAADLQVRLDAENDAIAQLEQATARTVEVELTTLGKKAAAAERDADGRIAIAEKKLSVETRARNSADQEAVATLKAKKMDFLALTTLLRDCSSHVDSWVAGLSEALGKVNTLMERLELGEPVPMPEYGDRQRLTEILNTAELRIRDVVGEIEKKEKAIKNLSEEMRGHSRLLARRRAAKAEVERLRADWKTLRTKREQLSERKGKRSSLYRELLQVIVKQKTQYGAIIDKFSSEKDAVLSDLDFEAELQFAEERLLAAVEDLVDNRRVQVYPTPQTPSVCSELVRALKGVADGSAGADSAVDGVDRLVRRLSAQLKTSRPGIVLELYKVLYRPYLSVRPTARYKRTILERLSLGQKATVLIKIYLAEGEQPIVIDSHDDHLDNEFIMEELVGAFREARKFRQVVVASNNGNVVVNSDADQIVVAQRRNGEISYSAGAMEDREIRAHALRVLEGGQQAFRKRQEKYRIGSVRRG